MCFSDSRNVAGNAPAARPIGASTAGTPNHVIDTSTQTQQRPKSSVAGKQNHHFDTNPDKLSRGGQMSAPGQFRPDMGLTPGMKRKLLVQQGIDPETHEAPRI